MIKFNSGDRVQWQEGSAGHYTCTGTIVNEEKYADGSNPLGWYNIRVDDGCWRIACHTAYEMSMHWVTRSVVFNKLSKLEVAV